LHPAFAVPKNVGWGNCGKGRELVG